MMPSGPSATARTAGASVTIENTISEAAAASRAVAAKRMPDLISGSALSRLRLKPMTVCPAAMSRGTMPTPMAPSPTKPMFILFDLVQFLIRHPEVLAFLGEPRGMHGPRGCNSLAAPSGPSPFEGRAKSAAASG